MPRRHRPAHARNGLRTIAALIAVWMLHATDAGATLLPYAIVFSGGGTGSFEYDDVTLSIPSFELDFAAFGSLASASFGPASTATVFGTPPSTPFILQDNTFFPLSGGTALSIRMSSDGSYCLRPDNAGCGAGDLQSGSYEITLVPEPTTAVLLAGGLLGLARRREGARRDDGR